MSDFLDKNIRVSVTKEENKHSDHIVRTIIISSEEGIKGLYCVSCKKNIAFIFSKNKNWEIAVAQKWVLDYIKKNRNNFNKYLESSGNKHKIDESDFHFVEAHLENEDGYSKIEKYIPNSDPFILSKDIENFTIGKDKRAQVAIDSNISEENIIKIDKHKQIVYGIFLVPEKADHHGDVISVDDVEKVAHKFLVDYRDVDEMHHIETLAADIVESGIAWEDGIEYYGKTLAKGTWFGAIKIHDQKVWNKVLSGIYKAFSVRIAGVREPIESQ